MRRAIEKHDTGQLILIPIIIRHSLWKNSPLASFQALPHGAKPISAWKDRDEAWVDVVTAIKDICQTDIPGKTEFRLADKTNSDKAFKIGVMGSTGVGKSSLCNALFEREVVRVSDFVPQTRSVHSAKVNWGPNKIEIIDCPGIGWSFDDDKKYLQVYQDILNVSDMAIWVTNAGSRTTMSDYQLIHGSLSPFILGGKYFVLVVNKVDLVEPIHEWDIEHNMPGKSQLFNIERQIMYLSRTLALPRSVFLPVSCKEKYNIEQLQHQIVNSASRNSAT
jgi:small GTP-binding protein